MSRTDTCTSYPYLAGALGALLETAIGHMRTAAACLSSEHMLTEADRLEAIAAKLRAELNQSIANDVGAM